MSSTQPHSPLEHQRIRPPLGPREVREVRGVRGALLRKIQTPPADPAVPVVPLLGRTAPVDLPVQGGRAVLNPADLAPQATPAAPDLQDLQEVPEAQQESGSPASEDLELQ